MEQTRHFASTKIVKELLILGIDKQDAEKQRDLWLSHNPVVKVLKIHPVKREPQNLLTRIGGKNVPRVSIVVEYEEPDVRVAGSSPTAPRSEEGYCEKHSDASEYQNSRTNLLAREAGLNVK
jgi:hypothetical protein